jgi:hypothetical protein
MVATIGANHANFAGRNVNALGPSVNIHTKTPGIRGYSTLLSHPWNVISPIL